ncbi:MAG: EAL domain-containing protein [Wenzhouxiangella sp.]|jgi:EAL domain-containing protein (putative c-di-GMP-specific phosphodiesterase class I)/GGDEF domain-containing protein|nr:EAL domain-containing protein [Wenzhouxiangella sp.]
MRFSDLDLVQSVPMRSWRALTEIDTVAFLHVDLEGRIQHANAGVARVLGYRPEEIIGRELEMLLPEAARSDHAQFFSAYVRGRVAGEVRRSPIVRRTRHFPRSRAGNRSGELRFSAMHRDGHEVPISLTVNEVRTRAAELTGFVGLIVDCTEQQVLQDRIHRQALYDEATGLLNWRGLHEVAVDIDRDRRRSGSDGAFSLLHIAVDHFSSLAFNCKAVADHALKVTARWLSRRIESAALPGISHLARAPGETQFLVYLAGCGPAGAFELAERLRRDFRAVNLGTEVEPFQTSLSIGVASPRPGMTLDYAMSRAAHACQQAQLHGHDRVVCLDPRDVEVYELGLVIRQAMQCDRIEIHAQRLVPLHPSSEAGRDRGISFEVLCRLADRRGVVQEPARVFPAAEKLGLSLQLDLHVIGLVLDTLERHPEVHDEIAICSINLSGLSLSSQQLLAGIRRLLSDRSVSPGKLCFEITESARLSDHETALRNVLGLRDLGCRIALDDFGSGYSNFQSLTNWPIDIVKIDGSYVRRLLDGGAMTVDVEGMVASALARGVRIVAEYVENEAVTTALRRMGVSYAQGFHFHRGERLTQLLADIGRLRSSPG